MMVLAAILIVFPLCMAVAAVSDTLTMTIPNRVSVILLVGFFILAPFTGMSLAMMGTHLLGGLIVFAVCFGLFALNVMGGGDAKVLTASAVWFGLGANLLVYLVAISMIGGVLTVAFLFLRVRAGEMLLATRLPIPNHFHDQRAGIPYGIAIGAAGFLCYPQSPLMVYALAHLV